MLSQTFNNVQGTDLEQEFWIDLTDYLLDGYDTDYDDFEAYIEVQEANQGSK